MMKMTRNVELTAVLRCGRIRFVALVALRVHRLIGYSERSDGACSLVRCLFRFLDARHSVCVYVCVLVVFVARLKPETGDRRQETGEDATPAANE